MLINRNEEEKTPKHQQIKVKDCGLYPHIRLTYGIKSKAAINLPFNLHCKSIAALFFIIPYCHPIWGHCWLLAQQQPYIAMRVKRRRGIKIFHTHDVRKTCQRRVSTDNSHVSIHRQQSQHVGTKQCCQLKNCQTAAQAPPKPRRKGLK